MRRIAFFLTSILLIINFQSRASVSLNSFAVQSQFTSGNKIYSPNGVTFTADFSFLRTNSDGNPIEVKLVYKEGNIETVISSSSVSKTSWGSELSWASSISGTLSQNQTTGYVCLKYTVYDLSGGVIGSELSIVTYNITTTRPATGIGPEPAWTSPVPGGIPLYVYSQTLGGHFYDTEWRGASTDIIVDDAYGKRNYEGILGFVFKQQLPGTVMLYRKAKYDISGPTGDWILTTSTANLPGYAYLYDMGYVYESLAEGTLPVYQFNRPNDHYYKVGQNTLNGYALDGFAFNIIPEDFTIPYKVYEYWSPSLTDHLYTTSSVDIRNEYVSNGVPFKVFRGQVPEAFPVYSFWNIQDKDHLYSTSNVSTIGGGLWVNEGVAFYAYKSSATGRVPIYEYWSAQSTDHYYTTQNSSTIGGQWTRGGIAFYALPN